MTQTTSNAERRKSIFADYRNALTDSIRIKQLMLDDDALLAAFPEVSELLANAMAQGNRVILAGNGGSAADAQHIAAEFVSRFEFDRPGLPALSLSTDTSMLTALANDYGYDTVFRRQLEAQAREGDVFIGITTSGRSKNILAAFDACKRIPIVSVALCGAGGELENHATHVLRIPSHSTPRIQECHITLGHMLCSYVERRLFSHLKLT